MPVTGLLKTACWGYFQFGAEDSIRPIMVIWAIGKCDTIYVCASSKRVLRLYRASTHDLPVLWIESGQTLQPWSIYSLIWNKLIVRAAFNIWPAIRFENGVDTEQLVFTAKLCPLSKCVLTASVPDVVVPHSYVQIRTFFLLTLHISVWGNEGHE